jgi:hypothetical protein
MKRLRFCVIAIVCVAGGGFALSGGQGASYTDPQQKIEFLAKQIEMERVTGMEIFNVPSDINTNVAVTPERLKNIYSCKLTISRWGLQRESASLIAALQHTRVMTVKETGEVRWGLLFTLNGGSVEQLYLDGFGQRGQIDGVQVRFVGKLHEWLLSLSPCMK